MGPPGAGKGTQAARIVDAHGLVHLATGDILRHEIREGTPLGVEARTYVESGRLVPDEIIIKMISSRMLAASRGSGFLLDGFPRTLAQAESLDRTIEAHGVSLDAVLYVRVPDEVLLSRLGGRRSCEGCERVYHTTANPPSQPGICDACGGRLVVRKDDSADVIAERLRVYQAETAPVTAHYRRKGLLREIDGQRPIESIGAGIDDLLREVGVR